MTPAPLTGLESHGGASEGLNEEWRHWKTREDQAWSFSLCFVCGSRPWGAAAFHLCLFILLLNVRRFPPPSSRIYQLHYIGARNPGGRRDTLSESPRCWGGSRRWGDRAAGRSGDRQWLPEAVVLEQWKSRWDGRLAAVLLGRGGVAAIREGAEESAPFITNYSTGLAPFPRLSAPPHLSQLITNYKE